MGTNLKLTDAQRALLTRAIVRDSREPGHGTLIYTSGDISTARALERRGLVRIETRPVGYPLSAKFAIPTDAGRALHEVSCGCGRALHEVA